MNDQERSELIQRSNWAVHQLVEQLRVRAMGELGLQLYGRKYLQMMKAIGQYKALFSQGTVCPPECLAAALDESIDCINTFCDTCHRENRVDYMRDTLALIQNSLPPGA